MADRPRRDRRPHRDPAPVQPADAVTPLTLTSLSPRDACRDAVSASRLFFARGAATNITRRITGERTRRGLSAALAPGAQSSLVGVPTDDPGAPRPGASHPRRDTCSCNTGPIGTRARYLGPGH